MVNGGMTFYSDDEDEAEPLFVSNYHLEDDNDTPLSFSVLPIQWGESEDSDDSCKEQVFLHGFADNGLKKILFQVTAWRFDLSNVKPEVSLLSKDRRWIRLQKPRKSFEGTIRTILITIHFLHRVKKNPKLSSKSVWDNLCKDKELGYSFDLWTSFTVTYFFGSTLHSMTFFLFNIIICSSYKLKPSPNDLLNHMPLIGEAAKRDPVLAKSKVCISLFKDNVLLN